MFLRDVWVPTSTPGSPMIKVEKNLTPLRWKMEFHRSGANSMVTP